MTVATEHPVEAVPANAETARTLQGAPQAVKRSFPMALSITIGILTAAALTWFAYTLIWFLLLLYLSFVVATIVESPVRWLKCRGVPRAPATVGLMAGLVGLAVGAGYLLFNYAYGQFSAVSADFQQLPARANQWVEEFGRRWPAFGQMWQGHDITTRLRESIPSFWTMAQSGMKGLELLGFGVVCFFVVMYMVIEGPEHLKAFRRVFPKGARLEVTAVFEEMVHAHRAWFAGSIVNMISAATMSAVALWLIGIPGAVVLGLIAGLGEFVPNIGPLLSNAPVVVFTLIVAPQKLWMVILGFLVVQTIQGYGITPFVIKRSVQLPVLATIVAVLVMGTLFQVLGVVVAIPLTADLVVLWNYFNKRLEKDAPDGDTVNTGPAEVRAQIPATGGKWR